nr:potassium transporter 26-like [Ipomoea batatas]
MEVSKPFSPVSDKNDPENGRRFSGRRCFSDSQLVFPAATPTGDTMMSFYQPYRSHQLKAGISYSYPPMETLLLAYQSLGVVYGDLGTSPVNVFSATQLTNLSEEDLLGTLSLIFWALTILVLIKYTFIVIHADDHGEGGTFALYSQLCQHINIRSKLAIQSCMKGEPDDGPVYYGGSGGQLRAKTKKFIENSPGAQNFLTFIVLLGTCMVIGDGTLTPATCVISALQGIQSVSPKITQDHVVFMSAVLLIVLFAFQHCGTSKVSFAFSPIMLLWFATNTSIGIYNIIKYDPSILRAISPHYMVKFFIRNHKTAWDLLGAVFLGITGAEAMFADLGHFNKRAIQLGFCFVVYPSLIITYAGETAYLVRYPEKITNAYYSSIPEAVYWPMFGISTLAAIVASQSMISACFSIVKQSLSLECFPRVKIVHTSSKHEGQVYCPEINYTLMVLCVGLVIGFKGGVELANAYGVVVIWVMIITTFLTALVMLLIWNTNILLILGTPGTCFFFTDLVNGIPPIVRHYIQHTGSIQEIMVIVTVRTVPIKTVPPEERFSVQKLGVKGAYRCLVQFGYKDSQNVGGEECVSSMIARLQEVAESSGEKQKISSATQRGVIFVVGRTILKANGQNGRFSRFTINYLYRFLQKNCRGAISTAEFPLDKTLQVGMLYEI